MVGWRRFCNCFSACWGDGATSLDALYLVRCWVILLAITEFGTGADRSISKTSSGAVRHLPTIMAPWNMDDRSNDVGGWPVNFTTLVFDTQYIAYGPYFNDSSLALDAEAARAAAKNLRENGVPSLLRADHIFWSYLAFNPTTKTGCEGAPWPGDGSLCRDWRERWMKVHAAIAPFINNGTYIGVMLGDEILDSGCSLANFSAAAALVRETWPEAVIYANEGLNVMLTGGFNGGASSAHDPPPHTVYNGWVSDDPHWKLPRELDFISMDYYCSFRTCRGNFTPCELHGPGSGPVFDVSFEPRCAQTLRSLYERFVYPRISHSQLQPQQVASGSKEPRQTKALVVPGVFAPVENSPPCRAW